MQLTQAHRQWASRPDDERFESLSDLHGAVSIRKAQSKDGHVRMDAVSMSVNGQFLLLEGQQSQAALTHWSAGQMLTRLGIPRDLLAKLEPSTGTAVIMDRLPKALQAGEVDRRQRMLLDANGSLTIRALHGDRYERLWDQQVTQTLMEYLPPGWRNPVAYAKGEWGAPLVPSGLYSGDRDMFAFFVDGGDGASFDVDGNPFNRGFFTWNSEVGAKTFGYCSFMFNRVCGNNIVWGATDVNATSARHAGGANDVLRGFRRFLEVLNEPAAPDQFVRAVREAREHIAVALESRRDRTLDKAFERFGGKFTRPEIVDAFGAMLREESSPTGTRWDWLQGFTAMARTRANADDRARIEQVAAKVLLPVVRPQK